MDRMKYITNEDIKVLRTALNLAIVTQKIAKENLIPLFEEKDSDRYRIASEYCKVNLEKFEHLKSKLYQLSLYGEDIQNDKVASSFREWNERQSDTLRIKKGETEISNLRKQGWIGLAEELEKIAKEGNKDYVSISTIREMKA